jgi:predicted ATPase
MIKSPQQNYLTTELDPNTLSTSFEIQTNWHVITGATCSGKTTLINQLSKKGYKTIPEVARKYYSINGKKLRIDQDLEQLKNLSRGLTDILLNNENKLKPDDFLFLDRAFPDQLTYYRILGINPNEILADCFHYHYARIFILDRFSFIQDAVRYENEKTVEFLNEWHARDYSSLGYEVIKVPAIPPDERIEFVLKRILKDETSG